jgi:hypothetical protein
MCTKVSPFRQGTQTVRAVREMQESLIEALYAQTCPGICRL